MTATPSPRPVSAAPRDWFEELKTAENDFLALLDAAPPGREISLARTRIEEATMWAVRGMIR